MSDIHYDTRTGAVMAGGLSGTGSGKAGAAVKQKLRIIREESAEARSRSNQDLILLLENFNDQTDLVVEALKTGEAQAILGGWAITAKKGKNTNKNKKISESDAGQDNTSETSNSKSRSAQQAPPMHPPSTNDGKPSMNGGNTVQNHAPVTKASSQQSNREPLGNQVQRQLTANDIHIRIHLDEASLVPKEVPIPDIHAHAAAFSQLLAQRTESHMADIKHLDFAFEQVRRIVQGRYEVLRRNLDRSDEEVTELLYNRHSHSSELSDRVAQSSALMPKEYSEWQQDVTNFTADYKYDLHLAATPRFSYSLEEIQGEIIRFGNVATVLPSFSYKPVVQSASTPNQPVSLHMPTTQAPIGQTQQSVPVPSTATRNGPSNEGAGRSYSNQNNSKPNVSSSNGPRNEGAGHNFSNQNNSKRNVSSSYDNNKSRDIPRQLAGRRENGQQVSKPGRSAENRPDLRERVTIVPKDGTGVGPMESLVISGGDLTPEEMAALTRSLEESLQFSSPIQNNPSLNRNGTNYDSGDFCEQDIFSGGAVWTNSNATFVADQWNSGPDQQQHQSGFSASAEVLPQGDIHIKIRSNDGPPARGGPGYRGVRRGGRGMANGRGARGRGTYPGRGRSSRA